MGLSQVVSCCNGRILKVGRKVLETITCFKSGASEKKERIPIAGGGPSAH